MDAIVYCLLEYFVRIITTEWWLPIQELVNQNPKRIEVHSLRVPYLIDNFWCYVFGCPTHSVTFLPIYQLFNKAEVGQFEIPIFSKKNILRLQISVDYALGMQILETKNHLGRVKGNDLDRDLPIVMEKLDFGNISMFDEVSIETYHSFFLGDTVKL